ncbi:MAG: TolC family protein [Hyphomicrobiales bacterium]
MNPWIARGALAALLCLTPLASLRSFAAAESAPADSVPAPAAGGPAVEAPAAPPGSALTLVAAVQRALQSFPSVSAARAGRDAARAASGEAKSAFFPSLAIQSDATRFEKPMLVTPIHTFDLVSLPAFNRTIVQSSLAADLTLFDGGARLNRYRSARETARAGDASLDATQQALVTQTVAAYLAVVGDRDLLEAHDRRITALGGERDRVQKLLDTGKAARVDLLRVEAELASAEADRVRTAASLDDAERQLGRLTDLDPERTRASFLAPVTLSDTTLTSRDAWVATALEKSPAILAAKRRRLAAEASRRAAQGARFPEVSAMGAYTDWRDLDGDDALEWTAGLKLSFPIFTGGAIGQRVAKARAEADGASANERLAEIETRHAIDQAYSAVTAARARVTSLERAVARYTEVARIEELQLQAGAGTQTDYLKGEADLLAARANWIDARNGEIVARAELARVAGVLDPDWLSSRVETTR